MSATELQERYDDFLATRKRWADMVKGQTTSRVRYELELALGHELSTKVTAADKVGRDDFRDATEAVAATMDKTQMSEVHTLLDVLHEMNADVDDGSAVEAAIAHTKERIQDTIRELAFQEYRLGVLVGEQQ